ncbi:MAG: hypothetical protein NTX22_10760 [Ignavibacteriales bacterium]|nr:hypothetical protein [Ignavibacteriales bacterium]
MNTGQLLLTVGGMFLLAMVILRVNNNFLLTNKIMLNTKFGVLAVSLGTSVVEEASGKKFDAATDTTSISDMNLLTSPGSLGPKSGEVYPNFSDFDDFNGFTKVDSTMPSAIFYIKCRVCYVEPNTTSGKIVEVNKRTWHKKIEVRVTSPSMVDARGIKDTVKLSSIYSYWFAR